MKISRLFLSLILGSALAAVAGEQLWANFDTAATGSVANLSGWTRPAWLPGTLTAQVSAAQAYSPANSLEFPWHVNGSSAVYTNFNSIYNPTGEHPVIRCAARLFLQNTNTIFQLGLRNAGDSAFLSFQSDGGYGVFGFTNFYSVFVPLATSRFVDVTLYYNRSNNYYRLDYDGTNRLPWATNNALTSLIHTQFNQFAVTRLTNTASTTGLLLLDNVRVETFPPHVWAWWRCEGLPSAVERLGTFPPAPAWTTATEPGASDPVWDGTTDFHNDGAGRRYFTEITNCAVALPTVTNWTAEAVFRLPPGAGNTCFLDWAKGRGFDTNGARIYFSYDASYTSICYHVRDDQQANDDDESVFDATPFTPNGRWHHLALVKSNTTIAIYIDYQLQTNRNLTGVADGTYTFNTQTRATTGQTLNNGNNAGPDTLIDEIRVSGKALAVSEFLQPGQPMIVDIRNYASENPWELTMKGILNHTYRIETSPRLGPGADWQPGGGFVSENTFTIFTVPTTAGSNFVRVVREN